MRNYECMDCGKPGTFRDQGMMPKRCVPCRKKAKSARLMQRWKDDPKPRQEYMKAWYEKNRDQVKEKQRKWHQENKDTRRAALVAKKYNLDKKAFLDLLSSQNGKCAICGIPESELPKKLHVDHDHLCCSGNESCGKCVRGLLCSKCNMGVGYFNDSIELLMSAISYLQLKRNV